MRCGAPRSTTGYAALVLCASVALAGCRGTLPEPAIVPPKPPSPSVPDAMIAIAPAQWATENSVPVDLDGAVREGFEGARIHLVDARAAVEGRGHECATDETCVEEAAREAGAEKLLRTKLATLGGTVLVRMGVVDVTTGTRAEERQEVVNAATPERVRAAISSLAKQIAKPYVPPPPPPPPRIVHEQARWYEQWWVWTLVGTAVVGAAVGVGVAAATGAPGPDVVVTPP